MPRTLDRFFLAAVLVAGGFSLAGCKQAEGERCELDSDCAAGLECMGDPNGSTCAPIGGLRRDASSVPTGDASSIDTAAPVTGDSGSTADVAGPTPDAPPAATPDLAPDLVPDGAPAADGSSSG